MNYLYRKTYVLQICGCYTAKMSEQQSINNCSFKYPVIWVKNKIYQYNQYVNPAKSM